MKKFVLIIFCIAIIFASVSCSKNQEATIATNFPNNTITLEKPTGTPIPSLTPVPATYEDIIANKYVAFAVMSDGTVQSKGLNHNGITMVSHLSNIEKIKICEPDTDYYEDYFYYAITKNGEVFTQYKKLEAIGVKDISFSDRFSLIYKLEDDKYYKWRNGAEEQPLYREAEYIIIESGIFLLNSDGTITYTSRDNGWDKNKYPDVIEWTNIVQLDLVYNTIIGLRSDGTLLASGDNADLFNNFNITNAKEFYYSTEEYNGDVGFKINLLVLNHDGTVNLYSNIEKKINIDLSGANNIKKAAINLCGVYCINENGELLEYEFQSLKDLAHIRQVDDVKNLVPKSEVLFAVKTDGTIELAMDMITKDRTYTREDVKNLVREDYLSLDKTNIYDYLVVSDILNMKDLVDVSFENQAALALLGDGTIVGFSTAYNKSILPPPMMYDSYYNIDTLSNKAKAFVPNYFGSTIAAIITLDGKFIPLDPEGKGGIFDDATREKVLAWQDINKFIKFINEYACIKNDGYTIFTNGQERINLLNGFTYSIGQKTYELSLYTDGEITSGAKSNLGMETSSNVIEIAKIDRGCAVLTEKGMVYATMPYQSVVSEWNNVEHIYDSNAYVCALTKDGEILTTLIDNSWVK